MDIFTDPDRLKPPFRRSVAALGNFDGLHLGHQAVLARTVGLADERKTGAGVVITEPHPVHFFKPGLPPFRLTPRQVRLSLLRELGLDWVYILPFDAALAATEAKTFVRDILQQRLGLGGVVTGRDYHFGKNRRGDVQLLQQLSGAAGFDVTTLDLIGSEAGSSPPASKILSSSHIRRLVQGGAVHAAAALLGHWWRVEARVIEGDRRGRTIGFPTANLLMGDSIHPKEGVYSIRATVTQQPGQQQRQQPGQQQEQQGQQQRAGYQDVYDGVANFGRRPTFDKRTPLLEVHLFDCADSLYGASLGVEFVDFIRAERRFAGLEALKKQIARDCDRARQQLGDPANAREHFLIRPLRANAGGQMPERPGSARR